MQVGPKVVMLDKAQSLSAALELKASYETQDPSVLHDPTSTLQHP